MCLGQSITKWPKERWSMDVLSDSVYDSWHFRILTFVDSMHRERPAIEVAHSFLDSRTAVLERRAQTVGFPKAIHVDSGQSLPHKPWTNGGHDARSNCCSVTQERQPITPTLRPLVVAYVPNVWISTGLCPWMILRGRSRHEAHRTTPSARVQHWIN